MTCKHTKFSHKRFSSSEDAWQCYLRILLCQTIWFLWRLVWQRQGAYIFFCTHLLSQPLGPLPGKSMAHSKRREHPHLQAPSSRDFCSLPNSEMGPVGRNTWSMLQSYVHSLIFHRLMIHTHTHTHRHTICKFCLLQSCLYRKLFLVPSVPRYATNLSQKIQFLIL